MCTHDHIIFVYYVLQYTRVNVPGGWPRGKLNLSKTSYDQESNENYLRSRYTQDVFIIYCYLFVITFFFFFIHMESIAIPTYDFHPVSRSSRARVIVNSRNPVRC